MPTTAVQMMAEVRAKPAHADDVAEMFRSFAEHLRQRPGCERVEVYRGHDDPATFCVLLAFADEAAFAAHLEDEWRLRVVQFAGTLLAGQPRRQLMQRLV